ncbi:MULTISPECIES: transglycosylase domain-containing protein [Streptacidiphilus]|uniref:Transglycosylase domain-containing protein n=1 Tax=Streptacidiphilus cavernicola TaxID=3342716 RepID=A0ABV6UU36_9ACTN|nr:transglycosylase domain-containing protein [Streptacidiphilus jeojiense]
MAAKQISTPLQKVGNGLGLVGASVLAGAIVAGLAIPAVGAVGLGAKSTADDFNSISDSLAIPTLSQSSTIYDADGGVIATVYSRDRQVEPLSKIAPVMQNALIDIEDHRFYQHGAIDLTGTLRALTRNASSGSTQGGSTLTQQLVKNIFIEEAGDDATLVAQATAQTTDRKIKELRYAINFEKTLTKQQILDDYLNITYFGGKAYGVEAAAEQYFSVHASELTLPQAALLAGLVQAPSQYDPIANPEAALTRRNEVLNSMASYGTITPAAAKAAEATPVKLKIKHASEGCITAKKGEEFFCDYVKSIILKDPTFGKTAEERSAVWYTGGLKIYTTLNPKDQAADVKAVEDHAYASDKAIAASTMVEPGTGKILAMAQSRPYGTGTNQTEINYNADSQHSGGGGFPTGSIFKAVTAAAALEQGIPLSYTINSVASGDFPEMTNCNGDRLLATPGDENDTTTPYGNINMVQAMAASVNTYFVPLEAKVGLCNVVKMAQRLGLTYQGSADSKSPSGLTPLDQVQTLTLGVNSLTTLQIANLYATFSANGTYCSPTAISRITNSSGKDIKVPGSNCTQALTPSVAASVNTLLHSVVSDPGGTGASIGDIGGYDDAGKTGTTNNEDQAWFAGYTKQISDATMMTSPSAPSTYSLSGKTIGGTYYAKAWGYLTSGAVWHQAMVASMSGLPHLSLTVAAKPADAVKATTTTKNNGNNSNNGNNNNGNNGGNNNGGH